MAIVAYWRQSVQDYEVLNTDAMLAMYDVANTIASGGKVSKAQAIAAVQKAKEDVSEDKPPEWMLHSQGDE